jgi:hypothetical protein
MRYRIRQAQAAHRLGELDAAELEARLQTYHTVLSL